ncbi:unnamed protein product [Rotaria sordida]|uniref:Uncharacterized protein n=1 Tax=Rotaria sordida TaxID=392033 RepID=A0A819BIE5_9BILA|nr:unnamed protein product [Rotaria sordida]CAF3792885.1 unnamed protein product [Rotaria sordida]
MMENKGIYAFLNCHQDVFSRFFCDEGVPDWIAKNLGADTLKEFLLPFPLNFKREPDTEYPVLDQYLQHPFAQYYFTQAVINDFKVLCTNGNGILEAFASFWRAVASYFADRSGGYHTVGFGPSSVSCSDVQKVARSDSQSR